MGPDFAPATRKERALESLTRGRNAWIPTSATLTQLALTGEPRGNCSRQKLPIHKRLITNMAVFIVCHKDLPSYPPPEGAKIIWLNSKPPLDNKE